MTALKIAVALLLAAALPAAAQVYRCDAGGRTTYQNSPCADGAAARTVDTSNAAFGAQVVDYGALTRLQAREREEQAQRLASVAAARRLAAQQERAAEHAALLAAERERAAAAAAIADELAALRRDGLGVTVVDRRPVYRPAPPVRPAPLPTAPLPVRPQ